MTIRDQTDPGPEFAALVGQRVRRAFMAETALLLLFGESRAVQVRHSEGVGLNALIFKYGRVHAESDRELETGVVAGILTELPIAGLAFCGMDGPVLDFGNRGIRLLPGGGCELLQRGTR